MGKNLAPKDIRDNDFIKELLESNNLKGTINEVLVARLYSLAHYSGDIKAIKLIMDTLNNKHGGSKNGVVINLIAPPQERAVDLSSDSWTVQGELK